MASSQEIDQMPATLPFPVHTLVFPPKSLVVCLVLPSRGLLALKTKCGFFVFGGSFGPQVSSVFPGDSLLMAS